MEQSGKAAAHTLRSVYSKGDISERIGKSEVIHPTQVCIHAYIPCAPQPRGGRKARIHQSWGQKSTKLFKTPSQFAVRSEKKEAKERVKE